MIIILIVATAVIWYLISISAEKKWSQMTEEEKQEQFELWYADDYCDKDD